MNPLLRSIASALLLTAALSGCSTLHPAPAVTQAADAPPAAVPAQALAKAAIAPIIPETAERTPAQVGQLILVWVAGYCEGWSKATGQDFELCFDNTVEDTMKQYKDNTGVDVSLKPGK